jgi:peptidyl-prolyl cis-trans isomerase NIMA-interacting 4
MGKNDKKASGGGSGGGKGKGNNDKEAGKAKGAQSINVRHILVG